MTAFYENQMVESLKEIATTLEKIRIELARQDMATVAKNKELLVVLQQWDQDGLPVRKEDE